MKLTISKIKIQGQLSLRKCSLFLFLIYKCHLIFTLFSIFSVIGLVTLVAVCILKNVISHNISKKY